MDAQEIRALLGKSIFERAQKYRKRILQSSCTTNEDGVRHLTALVQGSGPDCYYTQVWLRENGSFVSASCDCPYNQNGDGTYCKHIGALLLQDAEKNPPAPDAPAKKPESIPGVQRGVAGLSAEPRKDSYSAGLDMLFGRKWRGEEPETDYEAQLLLKRYQREDAQQQPPPAAQRTGFALLEPELTPHNGRIWLRLRVSDGIGGRQYLVKSIPQFLDAIEQGESVSYGKSLAFVHRWDAFAPDAQQLLRLLRRQVSARQAFEAEGTVRSGWEKGPAGGLPLTGEGLDALVELYAAEGVVGGYTLKEGLPVISLKVERRKGGVQLSCTPALSGVQGLDYAYLLGETTLWRMQREECRRVLPVLETFGGRSLFFTSADAAAFCSYVLPELGNRVNIVDPDRLLLNQIPLEPVVQFYLDADRGLTVTAYPVFLYGEDRVAPGEPVPPDLLRDARTENRAKRLLETYLEPESGKPGHYSISGEEALFQLLEEGIPALLAMGEVYQTDAFRNLQAAPPKISVGVSVHGSVLDLEVDTGAFPVEELRELLQSLHQKKRYHRLRDGSLLRLDDSLEGLDELNDTLELSGAKLKDGHAALPLYRAPTLDWALSGQNGLRFDRDDAFRRISRSFHAVRDSEYTPPLSLQKTLRKYQRDGYRWLRTLDGYGMGGILADDMGLGKTVQVLSYLLAMKEGGQQLPSLIVCPASLVLNWQEECQKFTPQLQSVAMDGDAAHRAALVDGWAQADIVITSYDLLRRDEERYAEQAFYACILDEAQAIKNHTTQKYKAVCRVNSRVRFALTGTPVENRLGELWSIFSFLMPGYLPPYKTFCARFEKPIVQDEDANAVRRLNQFTGPFILRRMKSEVLRELPPKTENVRRVELETEQRKLYLAAVVDAREKLRAAKPEDKMTVFAVLMRLREICCDPRLVADNWTGSSAKLDACLELVTEAVAGGHRILLFSQFTSMLELLAKRLDEAGVSHFTLQGSTPKPVRAEQVRRFNQGEADVFLISLRAGGTGLNLTAADIVIHYDPWWNLAAQNQATDRAYRIGQRNPVQVYRLIAQDTIEEKIVELQQAKQSLADTVTGGADGAILSMNPEQLLQLLGEEA